MVMHRFVLVASLLVFAIGCGSGVNDPDRVPEGAPDTADPSSVKMKDMSESGAPKGAEPGPPGE